MATTLIITEQVLMFRSKRNFLYIREKIKQGAIMNKKQLAGLLSNTLYPVRIGDELRKQAKENGLVIVYASDDLMELEGAIRDEFGCYGGGTARIDKEGILPHFDNIELEDDMGQYLNRKKNAQSIESLWCKENEYSWTYKTEIPHETFDVLRCDEKYCRGIVFSLSDLPSPDDITEKALKFYESAACYFAEGVEFMTKEHIYDAMRKEFYE